jgi:hypothetical protein
MRKRSGTALSCLQFCGPPSTPSAELKTGRDPRYGTEVVAWAALAKCNEIAKNPAARAAGPARQGPLPPRPGQLARDVATRCGAAKGLSRKGGDGSAQGERAPAGPPQPVQ